MKTNLFIVIAILTSASFVEAKTVNGKEISAPASAEECTQIAHEAANAYRPLDDNAFEQLARLQDLFVKKNCGTVYDINAQITQITETQDALFGAPTPPRGSTLITDDLPETETPKEFIDENISTSSSSVPMGEGQFYSPEDRNSNVTKVTPVKTKAPSAAAQRKGSR